MILVPVAIEDFKKLNEFAEAAMIVRNPDTAQEIKAARKRLLEEHNPSFTKPKQPKPENN